jgi:plasmid stability protein
MRHVASKGAKKTRAEGETSCQELLIPEMPPELHQRLVDSANRHQRSVAGEVLALLDEALRNGDMAGQPSWTGSRKKRKTEKHIAPPATAEEIKKAVGVTPKDRAIVRKVLTDLGYIGKKSVKPKAAPKTSIKSRKG